LTAHRQIWLTPIREVLKNFESQGQIIHVAAGQKEPSAPEK